MDLAATFQLARIIGGNQSKGIRDKIRESNQSRESGTRFLASLPYNPTSMIDGAFLTTKTLIGISMAL